MKYITVFQTVVMVGMSIWLSFRKKALFLPSTIKEHNMSKLTTLSSKQHYAVTIPSMAVILACLAIATTLPALAQQSSVPVTDLYDVQSYNLGGWYTGIQLVDMDGDGLPEVVAGNRNTSRVEIWTDDPSPGYSLQKVDEIQMPYHVHDLKVADVDENGVQDLVVGGRGWGIRVAVDGGPQTASFWPRNWLVSTVDGVYNWQVIVADFDGDAHLDIFDGIDRNYAKLFYGNGNGTFTGGPTPSIPQGGRRAVGHNAVDLNGDGRLDILGFDGVVGTSYVRAFLNESLPNSPSWSADIGVSFMPDVGYEALNFGQPTAGDFDGNGYTDIVALQTLWPVSSSSTSEVILFEGIEASGALVWTKRTIDTLNGGQLGATMVDINSDGALDIIVNGLSNGLTVYYGDGFGGFEKTVLTMERWIAQMNSLPVGDANGDGLTDLVISPQTVNGAEGGGFQVLLQIPPPVVRLSCLGFESPLNAGPVKVKKKRALPLKAQLLDSDDIPVTDALLDIPPVLQVVYNPATGGEPVDVTGDALASGLGTEGNQFELNIDKWQFNLKTKNYSAAGTYTMTMISGDSYVINPSCQASFIIE